ncbi:ReoY family proteolytic degradation factor [Bhargavaea massiliensis]|uniref:ReoY family proteolytic degradation factor n=1 Tax=Bhargavaea massiliensis TaxID=2697500 RepID=UPI001BCACE7E
MTASVPVAEKKEFVRWFLKTYHLKRRECVWILNYLLSHDQLLNHVRFVDEAHYCPRAMVMSTTDSDGIPFRFYKGNLMTADAEKSFHDLRLHPEENMYLQLNFPNRHACPEYAAVLEDNPYVPEYIKISDKDRREAEQLLEESVLAFREEQLLRQIDEALDQNDKDKFFALSKTLQSLKEIGSK